MRSPRIILTVFPCEREYNKRKRVLGDGRSTSDRYVTITIYLHQNPYSFPTRFGTGMSVKSMCSAGDCGALPEVPAVVDRDTREVGSSKRIAAALVGLSSAVFVVALSSSSSSSESRASSLASIELSSELSISSTRNYEHKERTIKPLVYWYCLLATILGLLQLDPCLCCTNLDSRPIHCRPLPLVRHHLLLASPSWGLHTLFPDPCAIVPSPACSSGWFPSCPWVVHTLSPRTSVVVPSRVGHRLLFRLVPLPSLGCTYLVPRSLRCRPLSCVGHCLLFGLSLETVQPLQALETFYGRAQRRPFLWAAALHVRRRRL